MYVRFGSWRALESMLMAQLGSEEQSGIRVAVRAMFRMLYALPVHWRVCNPQIQGGRMGQRQTGPELKETSRVCMVVDGDGKSVACRYRPRFRLGLCCVHASVALLAA